MIDADFDKFFEQNFPLVIKCLIRAGTDPADAEDSGGEAMKRVYERWDTIANPKAYVYTTALHHAAGEARRRARDLDRAVWSVSADVRFAAADGVAVNEDHILLRELISSLPPRQRSVLTLGLSDLDDAEIAEIMGTNQATVRSNRRHAVEALGREIERRGIPPESWERR